MHHIQDVCGLFVIPRGWNIRVLVLLLSASLNAMSDTEHEQVHFFQVINPFYYTFF